MYKLPGVGSLLGDGESHHTVNSSVLLSISSSAMVIGWAAAWGWTSRLAFVCFESTIFGEAINSYKERRELLMATTRYTIDLVTGLHPWDVYTQFVALKYNLKRSSSVLQLHVIVSMNCHRITCHGRFLSLREYGNGNRTEIWAEYSTTVQSHAW